MISALKRIRGVRAPLTPSTLIGRLGGGMGKGAAQSIDLRQLTSRQVSGGQVGSSTLSRTLPHDNSGPKSPVGTTSATYVMMGLARTLTPSFSGILHVTVSGSLKTDTSGDGAQARVYYGTGSPPANGDAVTGTGIGGTALFNQAPGNNASNSFSLSAMIPALVIGTVYWIDLALQAISGGTASAVNINVTTFEH